MPAFVNPYTGQSLNLGGAPSFAQLDAVQNTVDQQTAVQQAAGQNPFIQSVFTRLGMFDKLGMTHTGGINPMLQKTQQRLNNWNPFLQPSAPAQHPFVPPTPANAASHYQMLFQPGSHQSQSVVPYF